MAQFPTEDEKIRLEKILSDLQDMEPENWLDLLEAIVSLHDKNVVMYNAAKSFILPQ